MAKINLTNQHNQENLGAVASFGVLMCMIVTIVGIKLWWFKHRLSFEQTSTQNGAAGGGTPSVIVPRRSKQPKYKKDKRYSQQIYDSGEVHGVFRQKREDDLEIERPQQLPPVRIRQLSESTSSLILPPPRTKRRDQVHSTAFEDLEIVTPPLTTASSSDLTAINESNTKISLTFEEFEKQFKLKEIKPEVPEPAVSNEVIEIPVPPLRLNRSSSAMVKPEKTQRYLKSSQSITIPEFHKVIERRPTGLSRPTEDLTKIDDYDEPKLFETFGERRPTGYIKYEEVDSDLQDQFEEELNKKAAKGVSANLESPKELPALEALRNERIVYNNDLNESPDVQFTEKYNFNIKSFKFNELEDVEYKEEDFEDRTKNKFAEINEISSVKFEELGTEKYSNTEVERRSNEFVEYPHTDEDEIVPEFKTVKDRRPTEFVKDFETSEQEFEYRSVKEGRPTEFIKDPQPEAEEIITNPQTTEEYRTEIHSIKEGKPTTFISESIIHTTANGSAEIFESSSLIEDFDSQFTNWPQFEEKFEMPKVNVRRFNSAEFEPQISFEEAEDFTIANHKEERSISFNVNEIANESLDKFTLNQRRPTGFVRNWPESPVESETEEWQETSHNQKKFYSQVRSIITTGDSTHIEQREVTFESSAVKNSDSDSDFNYSPIKQRRPTGFVRKDEYSVTYSDDDSDEDQKNNLPSQQKTQIGNVKIEEIQSSKVTFEDSGFSTWAESETEKFTLNQRRPTGLVRTLNNEDIWNEEDPGNVLQTQVKFHNSTDFKDEQNDWDSDIKQRRPTGYIKKMEMLDLTDEESDNQSSFIKERRPTGFNREFSFEDEEMTKQDLENKEIPLNSKVRFQEMEQSCEDSENNQESLIKQRRPTGYVRKDEMDHMEKQVNFQLNDENYQNNVSSENEALKQRRPTGFIKKEEITKEVNFQLEQNSDEETEFGNEQLRQRRPTGFIRKEETIKQVNFELDKNSDNEMKSEFGNEQLRQRRPTGFVRKKELKCLENPPPIYQPSEEDNNVDFDNNLWQELEKDIEQDVSQNIEEEFSKIRHSYELNEADFLELKDGLQKSPLNSPQDSLCFGKTIENDWDNFQKLQTQNINKQPLQSPQEIKITFSDTEFVTPTTSILKEHKQEEDIQPKPRKSKVTFDFKPNERVIPARKTHNDSEEDSDYNDDDVYDKPPPPIPPQPMQRLSNINYNIESTLTPIVPIPTKISLFGSQISREDDDEDSWSAIRKHRNLTVELQNVNTDSKLESPPPPFYTPPPKPSYRNPMAQLAIQRAKEARADLDGYKSRSINDKKPEASRRQRQQFLNLNNDDHEGTDA